MNPWLFYKATPVEGGTQVEFRRVQFGKVSTFLPDKLHGTFTVPAGIDTEKAVENLVRQSGWVGQPARPAGDELGKAILQGRW